jgi:hypothetical protein
LETVLIGSKRRKRNVTPSPTRADRSMSTKADENQTDRRREISAALWHLHWKRAASIMKTLSRHTWPAKAQS